MNRDLEEIYSKENIKKLLNNESSLEDLNEFDLKMEMLDDLKLKKMYDDFIKKNLHLAYEDLFLPNHILERYLVYKALAKIQYTFDCDSLPFVKKVYGVQSKDCCDTLLSMQSIYSRIMSNKPFLEQLGNIQELKNSVYYSDICRFIIYYHTIGNMCPCPSWNQYNKSKYFCNKKGFDRLDLFKHTSYFKENEYDKFFTKEQIQNLALKNIYDGALLPNLEETNRIFEEKNENKIKKYIHTYIELIIERTELLYKNKRLNLKKS